MGEYLALFLRHQSAVTKETEDNLEVSLGNGSKQFRLNGTAKMVWELTVRPISLDKIVAAISNAYGRSSSLTRNEVLRFLDEAAHYGLIVQFISKSETPGSSV